MVPSKYMCDSYFMLKLVCFAFLSFAMERFLTLHRVTSEGGVPVALDGKPRPAPLVAEPLASPKAIDLPPSHQVYRVKIA